MIKIKFKLSNYKILMLKNLKILLKIYFLDNLWHLLISNYQSIKFLYLENIPPEMSFLSIRV